MCMHSTTFYTSLPSQVLVVENEVDMQLMYAPHCVAMQSRPWVVTLNADCMY
jgi:hypothetical protein